jgi:LytS/YehU family sensor histidine kinase
VKKNTDKAIAFLNSFSNHIRKIMTNAGQTQISVLDECESLKEYLNLEQMRMDNSFTYNISIESNVMIEQKLILPMIIQPVVENSIWHGVSQSNRNCHIAISFKQIGNRISCTIEDDGIGLKKQKALNENPNKKSLSIALENIKERLRMVADLHNSEWSFTITDRSDIGPALTGTRVVIEFPEI